MECCQAQLLPLLSKAESVAGAMGNAYAGYEEPWL